MVLVSNLPRAATRYTQTRQLAVQTLCHGHCRTSAERQQRGPSHRHAAAGVRSVQLILQGPAHSISAGIGPEGVGGHAAAGGEKAETRTRRLLLLLMQHAHDALKREGGGPCVACGAQRAAADTQGIKARHGTASAMLGGGRRRSPPPANTETECIAHHTRQPLSHP